MADEILKDEELEQVACGTWYDSRQDVKFLQTCGILRQDDTARLDTLTRAWGKQGITVVMHEDNEYANEYYKDGEQISRQEALRFVAEKNGLSAMGLHNFM